MLCSLGVPGQAMTNRQGHSPRTNHSGIRVKLGDRGRNEKRLERTASQRHAARRAKSKQSCKYSVPTPSTHSRQTSNIKVIVMDFWACGLGLQFESST